MKNNTHIKSLDLNPQKETKKVVSFLQKTFSAAGIKNAVLGVSGGIDSMTSLHLLRNSFDPEYIFVTHLFYEKNYSDELKSIFKNLGIPDKNTHFISIKKQVDTIAELTHVDEDKNLSQIRIGNIAARVRMIILYDLSKKYGALVCGTENRSEHLLGYFTRFGDAASDFEPIQHLYKTQVYQLAAHLKVPDSVMKRTPSADLWKGQTDEGEFGFSYQEADLVLHNHFDRDVPIQTLEKNGFPLAARIIARSKDNHFKHLVPYSIQ